MSAGLHKAIRMKGSARNLARDIDATPQLLNSWLNNGVDVPLEYAFEIARVTEGQVTWQEVAPHLTRFSKRWSSPITSNAVSRIQSVRVALSRITPASQLPTRIISELHELFHDIQHHGLQNPICVDSNNHLISGMKRLHVYLQLGKKTILAWRLSLQDLLEGKYSEEELKEIFSISERVDIGIALEKWMGCRHGGNRKGFQVQNSALEPGQRSRSLIARQLGFGSHFTYEQAKKIRRYGIPALIDAVDHQRLAISTAAALTKLSSEQQKQVLTWTPKKITAFVSQMRHQPQGDFSTTNLFLLEEVR